MEYHARLTSLRRPLTISVVTFLGLILGYALWVTHRACEPERPGPASNQGSSIKTLPPVTDPITCRVVSEVRKGRRARSIQGADAYETSATFKSSSGHNPLIDIYYSNVITNATTKELILTPSNGENFQVERVILNSDNQQVEWSNWATVSTFTFTWAYYCPVLEPSGPRMLPGQTEARDVNLLARIQTTSEFKPGRYTLFTVVSYTLTSDGQRRTVKSPPILITLTDEHIREWRSAAFSTKSWPE